MIATKPIMTEKFHKSWQTTLSLHYKYVMWRKILLLKISSEQDG